MTKIKIRTFIAIELPDPIIEAIGSMQKKMKQSGFKMRWVRPENIHLTLKFLGDTEKSRIESIAQIMDKALEKQGEIKAKLTELGFFPHLRNPRIAWIAPDPKSAEQVTKIQSPIETLLRKEGFASEKRSFHPHITIARIKVCRSKPEHFIENFSSSFPQSSFLMNEIILYKSQLRPEAAFYDPIHIFRLKPA